MVGPTAATLSTILVAIILAALCIWHSPYLAKRLASLLDARATSLEHYRETFRGQLSKENELRGIK